MAKQSIKAIIKRSKLLNDFVKDRNNATFWKLKRSLQKCLQKTTQLMCSPFAKTKKHYFSNLVSKLLTNNKKFQKSAELFSDKITVNKIITLTENGQIFSSDTDIDDTFNDYFSNVVQSQYPNGKLHVEHGSLHRSSIGSNREIQTSSKYNFH